MKDISIEKENIKIKDMKDSRSVKKEKGEKLFEKMTDETFPEIKTDLRSQMGRVPTARKFEKTVITETHSN